MRRPPVADPNIDQAERWPRPGSLSHRCDPIGIPRFFLVPPFSSLSFSLSLSQPLLPLRSYAACGDALLLLLARESAADYEQVRRYCSSCFHART